MEAVSLFINPKPFIGVRRTGGLWKSCFCTLTNSGQSPGNYNTDSFCALLVTRLLGTFCSKLRSEPILGRLIHGAPGTAGGHTLRPTETCPGPQLQECLSSFEPRFKKPGLPCLLGMQLCQSRGKDWSFVLIILWDLPEHIFICFLEFV